jgi:hypothetical protein
MDEAKASGKGNPAPNYGTITTFTVLAGST